jgi:hypothetical protein
MNALLEHGRQDRRNAMAYKERDVTERELRTAMQQVVQHAHAPQGSHLRLSKEDLMRQIDVLEKAWRDVEWTVYYP